MHEEYIQHSMFEVEEEATPKERPKRRRIPRVPEDAIRSTFDFSHLDFTRPEFARSLRKAYAVILARRLESREE